MVSVADNLISILGYPKWVWAVSLNGYAHHASPDLAVALFFGEAGKTSTRPRWIKDKRYIERNTRTNGLRGEIQSPFWFHYGDRRSQTMSGQRLENGNSISNALSQPRKGRLHSTIEAAEYLGLSIWTLRGLLWGGEIPMVRFARKQYVDVRDLDAFIEEHKKTYL